MNNILQLAIAGLMTVVAVDWIFLKVLKVAKVKGLVDNPDARKLQKVPVLGGIAVFFGVLMGLLVFRAAIGIGTMVASMLPFYVHNKKSLYLRIPLHVL